jgi:hypothetical protein
MASLPWRPKATAATSAKAKAKSMQAMKVKKKTHVAVIEVLRVGSDAVHYRLWRHTRYLLSK